MKTNEGTLDRGLRVIAGLVLIGLAATGQIGIWGYIGVVPLLTGAVGMCPCILSWASTAARWASAEYARQPVTLHERAGVGWSGTR